MTDSPDFEPVKCWVFGPDVARVLLGAEVHLIVCGSQTYDHDKPAVLLPLRRYNELVEKAARYDDLCK